MTKGHGVKRRRLWHSKAFSGVQIYYTASRSHVPSPSRSSLLRTLARRGLSMLHLIQQAPAHHPCPFWLGPLKPGCNAGYCTSRLPRPAIPDSGKPDIIMYVTRVFCSPRDLASHPADRDKYFVAVTPRCCGSLRQTGQCPS